MFNLNCNHTDDCRFDSFFGWLRATKYCACNKWLPTCRWLQASVNLQSYSNLQPQNWTESCEEAQKKIINSNPNLFNQMWLHQGPTWGNPSRGESKSVAPGHWPSRPPLFRALDYIQINKFASRGPHVAHHSVYSCPQKHSGKIIKSEVSSNFHRKCLCWGLTWTETCFYFHRLAYISNEQRSPNFSSEGNISYYTKDRGRTS